MLVKKVRNEDSRVVFIIGAGASIDISNELSTVNITNRILDGVEKEAILTDYVVPLVKKIYVHLNENRKEIPNFEDLYQYLLDMRTQYTEDITKHLPEYKLPAFDEIKEGEEVEIIDTTIWYVINTVFKTIFNNRPNKWNEKWRDTIFKKFKETFGHVDIFTLNYDDYLDGVLDNLNDGYVKVEQTIDNIGYYRFDPEKCLTISKTDTINHIHGSIHFSRIKPPDDYYSPLQKYDTPYDNVGELCSYESQNHTIFQYLPIISGKDKANVLMYSPFREYYANLVKCIAISDCLVVIGYGFGDYHVNNLIFTFETNRDHKIIIISPNKPGIPSKDNVFELPDCEDGTIVSNNVNVYWYNGTFKSASSSVEMIINSVFRR